MQSTQWNGNPEWISHGNQDSTHSMLKVQRVIILRLALDPHTCFNTDLGTKKVGIRFFTMILSSSHSTSDEFQPSSESVIQLKNCHLSLGQCTWSNSYLFLNADAFLYVISVVCST